MFDALGRLSELMESRHLTVYMLAKKSGVSDSTIKSWFNRNGYPPIDKLEKICDTLEISLIEFFLADEALEDLPFYKDMEFISKKWALMNPGQKEALISVVKEFLKD